MSLNYIIQKIGRTGDQNYFVTTVGQIIFSQFVTMSDLDFTLFNDLNTLAHWENILGIS